MWRARLPRLLLLGVVHGLRRIGAAFLQQRREGHHVVRRLLLKDSLLVQDDVADRLVRRHGPSACLDLMADCGSARSAPAPGGQAGRRAI